MIVCVVVQDGRMHWFSRVLREKKSYDVTHVPHQPQNLRVVLRHLALLKTQRLMLKHLDKAKNLTDLSLGASMYNAFAICLFSGYHQKYIHISQYLWSKMCSVINHRTLPRINL